MKTKKIKCAICGKEFDKEISKIKYSEKQGKKHTCSRSCASRVTNDLRIAPPSSKNAMHTRRDKEKFPEKTKARQLVRQAIKTKKLVPSPHCEYCSKTCKTEGHHPDHFYVFSLVWLCKDCHAYFDKYKIFGYENDYSESLGYPKNYAPLANEEV